MASIGPATNDDFHIEFLDLKMSVAVVPSLEGAIVRINNYGTGHISVCSSFDQKAFAAFRDAFRGKGPEGIPLSADAPGSGPQ